MAIPPRGLRDISTLGKRFNVPTQPYKIYLQLSCVEMERARCVREKTNALARIAIIDARLLEIDSEQHTMLESLRKQALESASEPGGTKAPKAQGAIGSFRMRY